MDGLACCSPGGPARSQRRRCGSLFREVLACTRVLVLQAVSIIIMLGKVTEDSQEWRTVGPGLGGRAALLERGARPLLRLQRHASLATLEGGSSLASCYLEPPHLLDLDHPAPVAPLLLVASSGSCSIPCRYRQAASRHPGYRRRHLLAGSVRPVSLEPPPSSRCRPARS